MNQRFFYHNSNKIFFNFEVEKYNFKNFKIFFNSSTVESFLNIIIKQKKITKIRLRGQEIQGEM